MDRRIARRREQVRGFRRRRRLRRTLLVVGVLVLAAATLAVERSPLVALSEVRVEGTVRADPEQVRAAADLPLGTSILRLRLGDAEERVERLPLVADATVRRADPLTVVVSVRERQPVAVVEAEGRDVLVDETGLVIVSGNQVSLPVIAVADGVLASPAELQPGTPVGELPGVDNAHAVLTGLPGPLRSAVQRYEVGGADKLQLVLADGMRVRFGRATRLPEKARALGALLEDAAGSGATVIDVRAPSNPVIAP